MDNPSEMFKELFKHFMGEHEEKPTKLLRTLKTPTKALALLKSWEAADKEIDRLKEEIKDVESQKRIIKEKFWMSVEEKYPETAAEQTRYNHGTGLIEVYE